VFVILGHLTVYESSTEQDEFAKQLDSGLRLAENVYGRRFYVFGFSAKKKDILSMPKPHETVEKLFCGSSNPLPRTKNQHLTTRT